MVSKTFRVFLIFLLFLGNFVFCQEDQTTEGGNKKLRDEILAVYKFKGEEGLRSFLKENNENIPPTFIRDFAESGVEEKNEELLKISLILAETKKNEQFIAFVQFEMGRYFISVGNLEKGGSYFEKALPIFEKIKDPTLQGYVPLMKEVVSTLKNEDINKMEEIADMELRNFEKTGDLRGQANIYLGKGFLYASRGDHLKAFEMFEKASPLYEKAGDFEGQGNVFMSEGHLHGYNGDYRKSLEMYDKALSFFIKTGSLNGQGDIYKSKGDIYQHTGENFKAFEMYDKALPFFELSKAARKKAQVYLDKGSIYRNINDNSKALEMYKKALVFFEIEGTPQDYGNVYMRMGEIYFDNGENAGALEMNQKALSFFKEANDPYYEGFVYVKNARIYFETGDTSLALKMNEKALNIYKKLEDATAQGLIFVSLGDIYSALGDKLKALKMFDKALDYFDKAKDLNGQCFIYFSKGDIFSEICEYYRAIEMYEKAFSLSGKIGDIYLEGGVCCSIAYIYLLIGDYSRAMEMFNKSEVLFKKKNDTIGLAMVYGGKGDTHLMLGDNSKAMEMYEKELALVEKMGNNVGRDSVFRGRGDIYFNNGDYSAAMEMYIKALSFHTKWETNSKGDVYARMGDAHLWTGNNSLALQMYDKALKLQKKFGPDYSLSYTLHRKAQVLDKLGKKDDSLHLFEEAIKKLEKIRYKIVFPGMKKTFMEKIYEQYQETALFMLKNKYYDKGFNIINSLKARIFLEQLSEGIVKLEKGITAALLKRRDDLVFKLSLLSKKINETTQKEGEEELTKLKADCQNTENDLEDLLVKIRLENPLYASIQYPQPITAAELQKDTLKANEVLIQYFITGEKVYVNLVSRKGFKVVPLEIKEKEIDKMAADFLQPFNREGSKSRITIPMIARWLNRNSHVLYRSLFKPIEKALEGKTDIIIVPDGRLALIPFESFVIDDTNPGKPVYLLEKYRVKYIQSASALSFLRKYHQNERETNHFIGFGDPVYDYESFREGKPERGDSVLRVGPCTSVAKNSSLIAAGSENGYEDEIKKIHRGKYDREGGMFNRLPGSGQEVEAISGFFKSKNQKSVVYLREQANEENAKAADMKKFDYIHFSCHGILGENFQSLVLSQIPDSKEDGYLTLNEIMNCDYNAKLVVLSACQTGTGKMERAEGVTGLTRAVMYAGTTAVVASLWNVSDIGTKELMVKFYTNMLEKGMSKEEALRQAKLEMIKDGKYASPYFWSAFVMYGE